MTEWNLDINYQIGDFNLKFKKSWRAKTTGIMGPSGSGKSSLLEIILGVKEPGLFSGVIEKDGRVYCDTMKNIFVAPGRRGLAWVPQKPCLFPHMTVEENICFAGNVSDPEKSFEKIYQILKIDTLRNRHPRHLSGGEAQRVSIARALATKAKTILLDEPVSSLDAPLKQTTLVCLKECLSEFDIDLLYVSHDRREVEFLCEKLIEIK